jgi:hypothetical protein
VAIFLKKGLGAQLSFINGGFYPDDPSFLAIKRDTTTFIKINSIFVNNNTWNNTGVFVDGIDFSRHDGRDANVMLIGNAGVHGSYAHGTFSIEGNNLVTVISTPFGTGTIVPINYNSAIASVFAHKMTPEYNKFIHQSNYKADYTIHIAGFLESSNNQKIKVGLRLNNAGPLIGATSIRFSNQSRFENFSILAYVPEVQKGDFFGLYIWSDGSTNITIIDLNAIMESH